MEIKTEFTEGKNPFSIPKIIFPGDPDVARGRSRGELAVAWFAWSHCLPQASRLIPCHFIFVPASYHYWSTQPLPYSFQTIIRSTQKILCDWLSIQRRHPHLLQGLCSLLCNKSSPARKRLILRLLDTWYFAVEDHSKGVNTCNTALNSLIWKYQDFGSAQDLDKMEPICINCIIFFSKPNDPNSPI